MMIQINLCSSTASEHRKNEYFYEQFKHLKNGIFVPILILYMTIAITYKSSSYLFDEETYVINQELT